MRKIPLLSLLVSTGVATASPVYQMYDIPTECKIPFNCTSSPRSSSSLPPRSLVSEDFNLNKENEPDYDGLMKSKQIASSSAERTMELALSFVQQNNPCDETGTLYLAKLMSYFELGTSAYQALDERYQGVIDVIFDIAKEKIFSTEGQEVQNYIAPQAQCIATILKNQKKL